MEVETVQSAWTFGWEALVALSTLALAFVTLAAVIIPLRIERRRAADAEARRRKEAANLAMVFDHELHMAEGLATALIREVRSLWRTDVGDALLSGEEAIRRIETPLLLKFAPRMDRFDVETGTMALLVLSRILQAKKAVNERPPGPIPTEHAQRICLVQVRTAVNIVRETRAARLLLVKHRPANMAVTNRRAKYRQLRHSTATSNRVG